ncbi:Leucine-rich repeat - like 10 [Theobroma cacao]|nr:Leucine-rich repeat - like 10 [Theobroma cacao]
MLDLSNNRIYGQIPKWMWDVGKDSLFYLNLSHNSMTELEQLPWKNIRILDLSSNLIQGDPPIPPLTTSTFLISNNNLNGEMSDLICNVSYLEILDMSHNHLSGIIPQCFGKLSKSLRMLNLGTNKLHGTIPATFAKGCQLENLNLNANQLEGPLTRSILNCRSLQVLDLGNNKINATFPHWLGNLQELKVLVMKSNQMHGSINGKKRTHYFRKLQILDLSNNSFTGQLPTRYIENFKAMMNVEENRNVMPYIGRSSKKTGGFYSYSVHLIEKGQEVELMKIFATLTIIDLSNNKFEGEIPRVIGKLGSIIGLNLSHNYLVGHIPPSFGNLINLEWLDLSSNKLDGKIPEELLNLTMLSSLNLSTNELVGHIPEGKQFNRFENSSYEGNDGLCGFPLSRDCSSNEAQQPPPSKLQEEDHSKSEIRFGWKVVLIGYMSGFMFGVGTGYVVFRTGFVEIDEEEDEEIAKAAGIIDNPTICRSLLGFSLTSPDLVICTGSPDIPVKNYGDSPEFLEKNRCSIELSLENGIDGSDAKAKHKTPTVKFSTVCQTFEKEMSPDSSFELLPLPESADYLHKEHEHLPVISINAGCINGAVELDGVIYSDDDCYVGGDVIRTHTMVGDGVGNSLYNTARYGDFSYKFSSLEPGFYNIDLHFAEIVFTTAFAIEGQVKEKSRWFSSLRDMTRKLKIMKMEHIKLSEEVSMYNNCFKDINEIGSSILSRINQQADLHEDLKIKFLRGAKERKELYNKVLELKGNIRVFCRCRPLNSEEIAAGASMAVDFESAKDGELTVLSNGAPRKTFKFDAVFGPQADQADVFQDTAPFATSVLDGYNVCIFAYGQTGTGKTFTMEGTKEARGVNFRTLEELFRIINERQKLEIRQVGEGMHHVPGLVEAHVNNMNEVWEVLQTGSNARAVGSTNANEHSSRSHCIHCVMVKGENLLNGECTKSKLWLVDLAGSERVAKTEVHGERLKETQNINRSLSALGDVISALATKSPHIPFRS